nr:hypothetical protein CFP56_60689 [Quercus suber]
MPSVTVSFATLGEYLVGIACIAERYSQIPRILSLFDLMGTANLFGEAIQLPGPHSEAQNGHSSAHIQSFPKKQDLRYRSEKMHTGTAVSFLATSYTVASTRSWTTITVTPGSTSTSSVAYETATTVPVLYAGNEHLQYALLIENATAYDSSTISVDAPSSSVSSRFIETATLSPPDDQIYLTETVTADLPLIMSVETSSPSIPFWLTAPLGFSRPSDYPPSEDTAPNSISSTSVLQPSSSIPPVLQMATSTNGLIRRDEIASSSSAPPPQMTATCPDCCYHNPQCQLSLCVDRTVCPYKKFNIASIVTCERLGIVYRCSSSSASSFPIAQSADRSEASLR